jgi:cytochrome c oxidase subunit 2
MMDPNTSSFWLPPQASTVAPGYDLIFAAVTYLCLFCFVLIMGAMTYFAWKYRYRGADHKAEEISHNTTLEIAWSVVPLIVLMGLFAWGFKNFLEMTIPPKNALEVRVIGQKWVWNFEYDNGATSSKEFAVPIGKPVKLIMTSRDVLHSFFVPGFRQKMDVIPHRYTTLWFEATQLGPQQVFCTEYCGTDHSNMLGKVLVLEPAVYDKWIEAHKGPGANATPAERGKFVFEGKGGCTACHAVKTAAEQPAPVIGPRLFQAFGREEAMADGTKITVDENYIRESIENPNAKTVASFAAGQMPTFKGVLSDQEIGDLIAYIKSLK